MTLEAALTKIEKSEGKGAIWRMSDKPIVDIDVIPSGNIALDRALGVGGYARGRIVEIYGPESSGKSTLATHAVASAQAAGGICAYIDAEHAMDPVYAQAIGVDVDELLISQPDNGEQALSIALDLIESEEVTLVVIDSVAALVPRAEIAGDMGDSHVGLQARLMSQACRKMAGKANKTNTTVIFINQIREKIGVMFGSPEVTPGGRALKFYSSQRLDIRRKEAIKNGVEIIGNHTLVKVVKNKVAPPFKTAEFNIMYGEGMSTETTLLEFAAEYGVIKKSGVWYYDLDGTLLGQGIEPARLTLKSQPDMVAAIYEKTIAAINGETDD